MIKKLNTILKQVHPGYSDTSVYIRTTNVISIGIFLIFIIFKPYNFGRRLIGDSIVVTALVYAGCSYIIQMLNILWVKWFPDFFAPENWTLKRELGLILYQSGSIALGFWLLNYVLHFYEPSLKGLGMAWYIILCTGIIPYMILTSLRHVYLLRNSLKEAKNMNEQLAEDRRAAVSSGFLHCPQLLNKIEIGEFYYAESRKNELYIFCIKDNEPVTYKIRCTLSRFVKENAVNENMFQCHRAFVINMDKILHISGNAAAYQVLLNKNIPPVPVSRSFISAFKNKIQ